MTAILERWETSGDGRAVFLTTWARCTDSVLAAVQNGRLADAAWVLTLLDNLAAYYFITIEPDDDDLRRVTPPAWRAAHDAAASRDATAHEALILGVNAAINNDLPQAVCDALLAEWPLNNTRLERRHQDLCIVLDIVATVIDPAGGAVVDCGPRTLRAAEARARADCSRHIAHLVNAWSDEVWENAIALVTSADERWRDLIRDAVEHTALRRAHLVMCDITARAHLLELPAHRLDYVFPVRHEPLSCRVPARLPQWGGAAPAAAS